MDSQFQIKTESFRTVVVCNDVRISDRIFDCFLFKVTCGCVVNVIPVDVVNIEILTLNTAYLICSDLFI